MALLFASIPGRILGSEIRPRRHKCAACCFLTHAAGHIGREHKVPQLWLSVADHVRSRDYIIAATDEAARRREARRGKVPRHFMVRWLTTSKIGVPATDAVREGDTAFVMKQFWTPVHSSNADLIRMVL